jgi:membrane fusion protein (multidrug efflux system)
MNKHWLGLLLLAFLSWLLWRHFGFSDAAPPSMPATGVTEMQSLAVKAARAWREETAAQVQAVGSLMADESVVLRPEIAGRIAAFHFAEGQRVRAGEVLVELNADEQRAALAQIEAQENLDRQSFARIQAMQAKNLISQQLFDEAVARWKNTNAQLERDRVRLSKTRLVAPFTGVLGLRQVSIGDYVAPGQALINLEAIDPIKLDFKIPEKYAAQVAARQKIGVRVDAYPGRVFAGEVYAVDPRMDEGTRTLRLRARLPNADLALKPGMFARIELSLGAVRNAVFAPEQALVAKGSQAFLFRIERDKAVMTPVKTGERRPGSVEIIEGLAGGEWIVTDGQLKLHDGMPVKMMNQVGP